MRVLAAACLISLVAGAASAEAPATSLRPEARDTPASAQDEILAFAAMIEDGRQMPASVSGESTAAVDLLEAWSGPRPAARPETAAETAEAETTGAEADTALAGFRPQARPVREPEPVAPLELSEIVELSGALPVTTTLATRTLNFASASTLAVSRSFRPEARSVQVVQRAETARIERQRGMVCGDPSIQGETIPAIAAESPGCGISDPVRIRSVGGVALSTASVMDCRTAEALRDWVAQGARPAVGDTGGGIAALRVAGHYTCRPRNNQTGQRVSEHGKGRAIDIAGILLRNGTEITILNGWNNSNYGAKLRQMHRAACGTFGTVLGPDANRYHADHFHFDTARYRSGSYCR